MAKRLTFEINEELHSRLKSEAAQLGVSLGSHCASILEGGGVSPSVEIDSSSFAAYSLGDLRELNQKLLKEQPKDWKKSVANVNAEIRRRFLT